MKILNHISARIALIMVVMVLPLNIIALIYTYNEQKTIIDLETFNSQKLADYQMQQLENQMNRAGALLDVLLKRESDLLKIKNGDVTDYEYKSSKLKLFYRMRSMAETYDVADGYYFYFPRQQDGVVYGNADGKQQLTQLLWQMLENRDGEYYPVGWHIYEWDGQSYLVFRVSDVDILYGAAIRLQHFPNALGQSIAYPDPRISLTEQEMEPEDDDAVVIRSQAKNIHLMIELNRAEILKHVTVPQRLLKITTVSYQLLIPALYVVLRRLLIGPLKRINEAHRQIEQGNADYRITEHASSVEFQELSDSFNRMVDNLERLRIESYEKELSRQKMELQNLQLQIRPHFLLNTFNLIFTLSQKQENSAIQQTVLYLSEYFRYIFREEKELELFSKELKLIQGYVATASVRYSGRIKAEYELDPQLEFVRVPPLLLHNFVENAVKYGVKKGEVLHIRLTGHYEDNMVSFTIRDDGKGMTEEILIRNQLMLTGEWEPESQTEHLGLYNSLRRLHYFYGEEARIAVTSRLGEGTCFEVRFPYSI